MAPLWVVVGSASTQTLVLSFFTLPSLGPVHEIQTAQYLDQVIKRSDWLILASGNNIRLLLYYYSGFCLLLKTLVLAEGKINIIKSCFNQLFHLAYFLVLTDII